MISRGLVERVFSAASMQRWNDHPRPALFTELDKQAHKMVIAWVIARHEEAAGRIPDWIGLVEGGIFELLHRIVLTDIKPPIFHRMMQEQGPALNRWVLDQLANDIRGLPGGVPERFERYFTDPGWLGFEKKILEAAHFLATRWEFRIIEDAAARLYGIAETREAIDARIRTHTDLDAVATMLREEDLPANEQRLLAFTSLVGQLRFQQRWAHTPREPRTSVLGHMLFVGVISYLVSLEIGASPARRRNNFFAGLFHDLPESLTRDIVSPVKRSVAGLTDIIKLYEKQLMDEKLLPLVPLLREDLEYYTEVEFENKARTPDGRILTGLTDEEMAGKYDAESWNPLDGRVVKVCDQLAAYIEASQSVRYGITSPVLEAGMRNIYAEHGRFRLPQYDVGQLFDYFR